MLTYIDVIILSLGRTTALQQTTQDAIESLFLSESPGNIKFNVLVIESEKSLQPYQYPGSKTIYPSAPFGYGRYMNTGIRATVNRYVCLCNNDIIFHKNWASEIIMAMDNDPELLVASAYDENFHLGEGLPKFQPPLEGYLDVFSPWCIFLKREVFEVIGPFDENFVFWYFDDDFCQTIISHGIKHCLISSSFVTHLGSTSLKTLSNGAKRKLTELPGFYYRYKWGHQSYLRYRAELLAYKIKTTIGME